MKPYSGGGWKSVYKVTNRDEFFRAYDETGDLCMTLQTGVEFKEYFRCYVVGQEKVHIMQYDPRLPHAQRYILNLGTGGSGVAGAGGERCAEAMRGAGL